jgi:sugar/nucleoside kinase (ribokinase family)
MGARPALLSYVGLDGEGDDLFKACQARGLITDLIHRSADLPTDIYMAIEGANGLIAAIADAHSLEQAGDLILTPLRDGTLPQPFQGAVALDGNLTTDLLSHIAVDPLFEHADLRIAPASPGKADRLLPFIKAGRGTLYVNLEEASTICGASFTESAQAATALLAAGAARVAVTAGAGPVTVAGPNGSLTQTPPKVDVKRITGAGDTFMAAHIWAERLGHPPEACLTKALATTALYVAGETEI